jgi:hypothetical protein
LELFVLSFLVFALAAVGMAIGLIARGETNRVGCAGAAQIDGTRVGCAICQGSCDRGQGAEHASKLPCPPGCGRRATTDD